MSIFDRAKAWLDHEWPSECWSTRTERALVAELTKAEERGRQAGIAAAADYVAGIQKRGFHELAKSIHKLAEKKP